MRTAVLLLAYAALVSVLALLLLGRAGGWTVRAPRLAIWVWQTLTTTVVVSVVLAGLVLAVPTVPVSGNLAEVLHACVMALKERYAAPGGAAIAATGTVLSAAVLVRAGWCLARALLRARGERARHAAVLGMVGSDRPDLGVTVLDDDRPAVYCLPGTGHRIVLTSAALSALRPEELDAVIAHEWAHIRQRHHLVLAYAGALERAFPRVGLFGRAAQETRRLVEMAADDAAISRTGSVTLAGALVELAGAGVPAVSLAASGGHVAGRVRRLLAPQCPLHRVVSSTGVVLAATLLALPVAIAAQPAIAAANMSACPLPDRPVTGVQAGTSAP